MFFVRHSHSWINGLEKKANSIVLDTKPFHPDCKTIFLLFREGPMATLGGPPTSESGEGLCQLITNFCKSVSYNFYTLLIVCPTNLSMNLEQLIIDNPWSPVCASLAPLLSLPLPSLLAFPPPRLHETFWMKQCIILMVDQLTLTMMQCNDRPSFWRAMYLVFTNLQVCFSRVGHFGFFISSVKNGFFFHLWKMTFSIIKKIILCVFFQANNLFLQQSYLESPLPVKLTW